MVGRPSGVPPGAVAGLLAEPEPDRAAVAVPAEDGVESLAQDIRGDAGGGGSRVGSPGRLSGRVGYADDGAVSDRGGAGRCSVRHGVSEALQGGEWEPRTPRGESVYSPRDDGKNGGQISGRVSTHRYTQGRKNQSDDGIL